MHLEQKGELKKAKGRFRHKVLRLLNKINNDLKSIQDPYFDRDKKFLSNLKEWLEEGIPVAVDFEELKDFRFYLFYSMGIES